MSAKIQFAARPGVTDRPWIELGLVGFNQCGLDSQLVQGINLYRKRCPHWVLHDTGHREYDLNTLLRNPRLAGVFANVTDHHRMEVLQKWGGPVVDLSGTVPESPFPQVTVEPNAVGSFGAAYLHSIGLRDIVYVSGMEWSFEFDRWQGVRGYCHEHQLRAWWWIWSEARCVDAIHAPPLQAAGNCELHPSRFFLGQFPKPFGVLTAMDRVGVQVCDHCRDLGLAVPGHVAVLGVDNHTHHCECSTPPLSSIRLPGEEMGYHAGSLMDAALLGQEIPRFTRMSELNLEIRDSTSLS